MSATEKSLGAHAFRHHPELRARVADPMTSYFRHLDLKEIDARVVESGGRADWRRPDDEREAMRHDTLAARPDPDLWVFAYGSLIWDPAVLFDEIRRADVPGYARRFCLWDTGARGSEDQPGLMAALDTGPHCVGVVFRIPEVRLEEESFILFRRELIADAYLPRFVAAETAFGPVQVLAFVANHASDRIVPDIPLDEQARMIAHATGFLGSSFEYLDNLVSHLAEMGISDADLSDLHARVQAKRNPL